MYYLKITDSKDQKFKKEIYIEDEEIVIGKDKQNQVVLEDAVIKDKHLTIKKAGTFFYIKKEETTLPAKINGLPFSRKLKLYSDDEIELGRFKINIFFAKDVCDSEAVTDPKIKTETSVNRNQVSNIKTLPEYKRLFKKAYQYLKNMKDKEGAKDSLTKFIDKNLDDKENKSLKERKDLVVREMLDEFLGLGPIDKFLSDSEITDILVNGPREIFIEKNGKMILTDDMFISEKSVYKTIKRILEPLGKEVSELNPLADARLSDGSRVNIVIPPIAFRGPSISIRKFSKIPFTSKKLIELKTIDDNLAKFLKFCVESRLNIVISGGTSSGKTTLLNFLSSFIGKNERIVTIEDSAELKLAQPHVVPLEAKPPDAEGKGAIPIRVLVINALRMRPDRIIVGEVRGTEALDMLQAMNTGHDGSLCTIHSNSPRDVFSRLETMIGMSGIETSLRAIRGQIVSAINLIVHMARFSDSKRRVIKVTEITGMEGEVISTSDLFIFKQEGTTEDGKILGSLKPTGIIPSFCDRLKQAGCKVDMGMFK